MARKDRMKEATVVGASELQVLLKHLASILPAANARADAVVG